MSIRFAYGFKGNPRSCLYAENYKLFKDEKLYGKLFPSY